MIDQPDQDPAQYPKTTATYALRVVWRNSVDGELDARPAADEAQAKAILIDMITAGEMCAGDSFTIEVSE